MEIPENIRLRLLLTFDKTVFRKFYWFEMKGNDFYWGSAYKSASGNTSIKKEEGDLQTKITIPENFDKLTKLHAKFSYHASGSVHNKTQMGNGLSLYENHSQWLLKEEIKKPVRFYTLISRSLKYYDKIINNPNKDNTYALALYFPTKDEESRMYLEFFLSPEGVFNLPVTLMKGNNTPKNIATHSLNQNLILIVRYAIMANMNDWNPDKEISIILDKLE
jgi:hypothetical protein